MWFGAGNAEREVCHLIAKVACWPQRQNYFGVKQLGIHFPGEKKFV
jgi:hypothetical protein